jgi:hypothetical protein
MQKNTVHAFHAHCNYTKDTLLGISTVLVFLYELNQLAFFWLANAIFRQIKFFGLGSGPSQSKKSHPDPDKNRPAGSTTILF